MAFEYNYLTLSTLTLIFGLCNNYYYFFFILYPSLFFLYTIKEHIMYETLRLSILIWFSS